VAKRSPNPALFAGMGLFVLGGLADLGHHALPHPLSHMLDPLVGAGAVNAHLLLAIAMALVLIGLVQHGIQHRSAAVVAAQQSNQA